MSVYEPQEGVLAGRPPCRHCGAALRLHRVPPEQWRAMGGSGFQLTTDGLAKLHARGVALQCPEAYRPSSSEEARRELAAAEASGDANRIFVARGEVQRLEGR